MTTRIVAIASQKGGSGKTSVAVNLGAALARKGRKVLIVDLDHQCNASQHLGLRNAEDYQQNTYTVLKDLHPASDAIKALGGGLAIIPGDMRLAGLDQELASEIGREGILKDALSPVVKRFDWVLIDCPPSLGVAAANALCAARQVLIPVDPGFFALTGLDLLMHFIASVRKKANRSLTVLAIVPTRVDTRRVLDREIVARLQDSYPTLASKTVIRQCQAVGDAAAQGVSIDFAGGSAAALDFEALADEVSHDGEKE